MPFQQYTAQAQHTFCNIGNLNQDDCFKNTALDLSSAADSCRSDVKQKQWKNEQHWPGLGTGKASLVKAAVSIHIAACKERQRQYWRH